MPKRPRLRGSAAYLARTRKHARTSGTYGGRRSSGGKRRRTYRSRANARSGGFLGMERKFHDTGDAFSTMSTHWDSVTAMRDPATPLSLNGVAQDDGEQSRDGRKMVIDSIQVNGHCYVTQDETVATPVNWQQYRVAIVLDKQTNGAQMTADQVFVAGGAGEDLLAYRNLQYTSRYDVLYDSGVLQIETGNTVDPNSTAGANQTYSNWGSVTPFSMYHKFKGGLPVTFNNTTGVIGSVVDNSLHIIAICSSSPSGTTHSFHYTARIRFYG